jgi:mono/diheme cytochrome c family protein
MKKLLSLALALVLGFSALSLYSNETDAQGKQIFEANKCNNCHALQAAGIEMKMKTSKAPDLSKLSDEITSKDVLVSYLKKEAELNGKKHMAAFKGTDEELSVLADWLMSFKSNNNENGAE